METFSSQKNCPDTRGLLESHADFVSPGFTISAGHICANAVTVHLKGTDVVQEDRASRSHDAAVLFRIDSPGSDR
ncbi:MAG: hypothetical protein ABW168_17345, partial [Sedimenticola sp.]